VRWASVLSIGAITLTIMSGEILERHHWHRVPEAAIGVAIGALLASSEHWLRHSELLLHERFDPEFFMVWLLPPIIFAAGYNMDVSTFFANIGPTALFAFVGTVFSAFTVAAIIFGVGQAGLCYPLSPLAALFFGALISATDPVSVLAVFQAPGGAQQRASHMTAARTRPRQAPRRPWSALLRQAIGVRRDLFAIVRT
jgi:sodium/hydrogen exchanger 8